MVERDAVSLSPGQAAQKTSRWAKTMTKWLITRSRQTGVKWQLVEFGGRTGSESRGIVDIIAIRKDHRSANESLKRGDLFDIVLIQTKGGGARPPTETDIERLIKVKKHHRAKAIVLGDWDKGKMLRLRKLVGRKWVAVQPGEVFG
jgi:hypothetical protein